MKIKTLCFLGIIPIFLLLGLSISAFVCYFEYKETLWGLNESATSVAVTTSEFLSGNPFEQLCRDTIDPKMRESLLLPIKRALQYKKVQWITAYSTNQNQSIFELSSDLGAKWIQPDYKDMTKQLEQKDIILTNILNHNVLQAFIKIKDSHHDIAGILGVQIDAQILTHNFNKSFIQSSKGILFVLLAGLLCSLWIGRILKRDIETLQRPIDQLYTEIEIESKSSLSIPVKQSFIGEIQDLSNTFETMFSVLKSVITHSRRMLLDMELFRCDEDLVDMFRKECLSQNHFIEPGISFFIKSLQKDHPDVFHWVISTEKQVYCLFGRITPQDKKLETILSVSGVITYINHQLKSKSLLPTLQETLKLFSFNQFHVLNWERESKQLTYYYLNESTHQFDHQLLAFNNGNFKVFHNLNDSVEKQLMLYLTTFYQGDQFESASESKNIPLYNKTFYSSSDENEIIDKLSLITQNRNISPIGVIVIAYVTTDPKENEIYVDNG